MLQSCEECMTMPMLYTRLELPSRPFGELDRSPRELRPVKQPKLSCSDQKIKSTSIIELRRHSNFKIMEANSTEKFAFIKQLPLRIRLIGAIHFPLE